LHLLRAQCLSGLGQLTQATAAITLARDAAGRANVKHIALRIEQQAATLYELAGDLPQALQAMKRVVALQSDLEQFANLQMLRELKELAEKRTLPVHKT
jgi:hypothetical protein